MSNNIITDNPKHHKYTVVNKQEHKKITNKIIYPRLPIKVKPLLSIYNVITAFGEYFTFKHYRCTNHRNYYIKKCKYRAYKQSHPEEFAPTFLPANYIVMYDNASHTKYRVYQKKNNKLTLKYKKI